MSETIENTSTVKETRSFNAEISKVLQLMIHSLYTNKDIFLRELISNASDACEKLRYEAITRPELLREDAEFAITLMLDEKNRILTISDNGIGMNRDELIANLGTIARSGTQEFLKALEEAKGKDVNQIGQFGVGFYSAFMVADRVTVESRRAGEEKGNLWESEGTGEFTIQPLEQNIPRGTRIHLHIRGDAAIYLDKFRLRHIVQTYSDHIAFPIRLIDSEGKEEVLNEGSALWARSKSEVSEEQYKEFYHHVGHMPDTPWLVMHNRVEGKLDYTNLLFIPSMRPFDLFHPDRQRRVKLYVKRVFITDEGINLIPHYLRFLRGVVDSADLPLNISRETLQHNALLDQMRDSITKRVLTELRKKMEKDATDYQNFWKNFGPVLKEGLCEATSPREQILEVCRFHSSERDESVSLDHYLERMKEEQEHIYYLTGESLAALRKSPQLEGFRKRGIEVLLLDDHVDEFWVSVVTNYKGKPFKSVTRAGEELEAISQAEKAETSGDDEAKKENTGDISHLIGLMKGVLGEEVKDIRTTAKLAESPVCLAVGEGDMDIRLQRFLVENKQLPGYSAKILELNPEHAIIRRLAKETEGKNTEQLTAELRDTMWMLLDQARIIEGEQVSDAGEFARRMSWALGKLLAA